jgi:H+/Cl- antiporter ClcA/CBS domain-containing protein
MNEDSESVERPESKKITSPAGRVADSSRTSGLPVAPGMDAALKSAHVPRQETLVDRRIFLITGVAIVVAFITALCAQVLVAFIGFLTNLLFYGRVSAQFITPFDNHLGLWVIPIPAIGGIVVGLIARYASETIRGHGFPEAMEQILLNESRIPPKNSFLKPLSSAIAMGTGGPFGAEGPIIATGGALGSLAGQLLRTSNIERRTLLAAGGAAGMAEIFGCPVAAVLLVMELLLFEYRPRSLIPVAFASVVGVSVRYFFLGSAPIFPMPNVANAGGSALLFYVILGAFVGYVGVQSTHLVFWFEEAYERLPIHWMWWPAIGGLAVGVIGYFAPHTLGVGYDNVSNLLNAETVGVAALILGLLKLLSWSVSVSSGTAGGTMAPLFTIGAGVGSFVGAIALMMWPHSHIDVRLAALVGMAAMFTSSYQTFLASIVLAFETTQQPAGLLPLIGGCALAYFVSCFTMRSSLITDKFAKMGVRVPIEQTADFLRGITAGELARSPVTVLKATQSAAKVQQTVDDEALRQGLIVEDENGYLIGLLTARDFIGIDQWSTATIGDLVHHPLAVAYQDTNMREAADHMVREKVGRLIVVERENPNHVLGMIRRQDVLAAHKLRLDHLNKEERVLHPRQKARKIWKNIVSHDSE